MPEEKPMTVSHPPSNDFLYRRIADRIAALITQGTLLPGDAVPSVRRLSSQEDVSVATVLQAYSLLESRGLIRARPQSGYYVRAGIKPAPPEPANPAPSSRPALVGVSGVVDKVLRAVGNPDVVQLGAACPAPDLLPHARLDRIARALCLRKDGAAHAYDPPPGHLPLRRMIALRALDWGGEIAPDGIVTTCGCMEALNLSLRAVAGPGDTVAIESPTYFSILQLLESLGIKALEIPTHPREGMDLDALEKALSVRRVAACLVQPNFHNPLGCVMPDDGKQRLVEMLGRRDIPLIEDDLYGDLHFGPMRPRTAKSFDRRGLVLYCSSFSKTISPGSRVGWVAAGRYLGRVRSLKQMSTIATPTLPQMMIAEFLREGGHDRHLRAMRRELARQVQLMTLAIRRHFPEGTKVTRPEGGFVLWVELDSEVDAVELFDRALASGVTMAPGPMFSAKQKYRNFIRLSCGNLWSDRIDAAMARLGRLVAGPARRRGNSPGRP
jgi:DNA-binding transcriptional MocR family regulator